MARLSDPAIREAITEIYETAKHRRDRAQAELELADAAFKVVDRLHDRMLDEPSLQVVGS